MAKSLSTVHRRKNSSLSKSLNVIKLVSNKMRKSFDAEFMNHTSRSPRYLERVSGYMDAVCDVCSKVLRSMGSDVYWFNGRYWEILSDVLLEESVIGALKGFVAERGDLVRGRSGILRAAHRGAMLSPLCPSKSLVGFSNGVVDFSDIDHPVMHPFGDMLDITSVLPYPYDPDALCPSWDSFLEQVLSIGQIRLLQMYMGLGVVPRNNMERKVEKTLWLVGSGGNGKSVIHDVMEYVYGSDSFSNVSLYNLIKPGDEGARFVSSIAGKTFNYCTEVDAGDISRYEGNFKSLVSGERQQARRIGGNVEMIDEIPYLVFNMNQQPANRNMGKAFMRRLVIIDFRAVVSEKDMRLDLVDTLVKEAPGIRNWLVEGYKKLRERGFKFDTPEENRQYMIDNEQTAMVFMSDMKYRADLLAGHQDERAQWVRASDLYDHYCKWCRAKLGIDPDNTTKFGRDLKRLHYTRKRTSVGNVYAVYSDKVIKYALDI